MLHCTFYLFLLQVLLAAEAPSREGSQTDITTTDEPSFSEIKPTRSDKEEKLFHRIQDSLSSKIPNMSSSKNNDEEEKTDSTSPASTVSSSGDMRGEYVINSGREQNEGEESQYEEEEDKESSEPPSEEDSECVFLLSYCSLAAPTVTCITLFIAQHYTTSNYCPVLL